MHGRVDLHRRPEQGEVADAHRTDVEHDAVEIEEYPLAELDVRPVYAIERRLHPDRIAARAEQGAQDATTFGLLRLARGIELLAEIPCTGPSCHELRVERVVHVV